MARFLSLQIGRMGVGDEAAIRKSTAAGEAAILRRFSAGDAERNARLFSPDLGRPHGITGHTNNAVLLTEKVKRFDRLLRQEDVPGRWKFAQ
jgi:hypothetical protein